MAQGSNMIYFTADHHFGHKNIIKYCDRPYDNINAMDDDLVARWNNVVGVNDTVYHLGDFTMGGMVDFIYYVEQLNGHINIIPGGHDYRWLKTAPQHTSTTIKVLPPLHTLEVDIGKKYPHVIVMCHYAMRTWDRSHYGAWHLFGHSHGDLAPFGKSFDVGVDCNNFTPLSYDQVGSRMIDLAAIENH